MRSTIRSAFVVGGVVFVWRIASELALERRKLLANAARRHESEAGRHGGTDDASPVSVPRRGSFATRLDWLFVFALSAALALSVVGIMNPLSDMAVWLAGGALGLAVLTLVANEVFSRNQPGQNQKRK